MPTPHAEEQATVAAVLFGSVQEGRRVLHDELLSEDELASKVRTAATTVVPKGALALIRRQVADAALEVLKIPFSDVLTGAWSRYSELMQAAELTRANPGRRDGRAHRDLGASPARGRSRRRHSGGEHPAAGGAAVHRPSPDGCGRAGGHRRGWLRQCSCRAVRRSGRRAAVDARARVRCDGCRSTARARDPVAAAPANHREPGTRPPVNNANGDQGILQAPVGLPKPPFRG
jgi:hypothetical protein